MTTHISQQQLESYLWGAATLLRGTIDAGDYKQFIFPLLFYKRLCVVKVRKLPRRPIQPEGLTRCFRQGRIAIQEVASRQIGHKYAKPKLDDQKLTALKLILRHELRRRSLG